ncbi:MAG TPA: DUF2974 domain-containing protein [Candidatus Merdenecus merdavium]|nr:DUF2974 domain-containing protein [Candidatus Merdenecus merdavium]
MRWLRDVDLLIATQLSYYDFPSFSQLSKLKRLTISQLLKEDGTQLSKLQKRWNKSQKSQSFLERFRGESALSLCEYLAHYMIWQGGWYLIDIRDDNQNSGLYACCIEVDPTTCIIAFRGSESTDEEQIKKDWLHADFGLLNSTLTYQQAVAEGYMRSINRKYKYEHVYLTGHSLGGNLALHGCLTAPQMLFERVRGCINFDGPGFSREYLEAYKPLIKERETDMIHFQWSLVGALLYHFEGCHYQSIRTNDEVYHRRDMEALVVKHDTCFVSFNEVGYTIPGEMDPFAKKVGRISRGVDRILD